MKPFYAVLINALAGSLTNTFVWFAVTFRVYLETRSVVATSLMAGVDLIGSWFGTCTGRGIALVFIMAGVLGLAATLLAMRSGAYRRLAARYQVQPVESTGSAERAMAA